MMVREKPRVSRLFRLPDEVNENPCFPTRNDRMAFINDNIVQERCVSVCPVLIELIGRRCLSSEFSPTI